jgi:hypothetical protein
MNQGTVIAVRFPPRAAWTLGHQFVRLSFLQIHGRVGQPTLDRHYKYSVTLLQSRMVPAVCSRPGSKTVDCTRHANCRIGPRPEAEGCGVAMKIEPFAGWRTARSSCLTSTILYLRQVWDRNDWLYKGQHGFRPGYSCESQVIPVCQGTADSLENGARLDAIITDF